MSVAGIGAPREPYDLADGYNHMALVVADPDGYRVELIDKDFPTPQDPPKEEWVESAG